jgi:hypothetical protein
MRSPAHEWIICADCYESYSLCRHTLTQNGDYNANGEVFSSEGSAFGPMPAASLRVFAVYIGHLADG